MYNSKNHSKFSLKYHIILVCKYRKNLMIHFGEYIKTTMIGRVLKQQDTVRLWNDFEPKLKKYFWKEKTFFTDGYFVSTIGEVSSKTSKKYIQNQG